ncbi:hypothetical protein NDU88_011121 [Pleurodeles waltl]|uniref:Uncharacterized protein n=1 Tax=Pleurodeles waltl TaxID=8319 RepID=A0AAV7S619_PLEWA|nr:hypothetical protein NDU88_011121 [Pleurodeles waltl]
MSRKNRLTDLTAPKPPGRQRRGSVWCNSRLRGSGHTCTRRDPRCRRRGRPHLGAQRLYLEDKETPGAPRFRKWSLPAAKVERQGLYHFCIWRGVQTSPNPHLGRYQVSPAMGVLYVGLIAPQRENAQAGGGRRLCILLRVQNRI